ncbi:14-3-3 protein 7, partial [Tanacetum coccineum]
MIRSMSICVYVYGLLGLLLAFWFQYSYILLLRYGGSNEFCCEIGCGTDCRGEKLVLLDIRMCLVQKEANGEMQHVALAKESLKRVEDELTSKCNEILLTIDDYLLPSSKTGEAAVFYHKMKGDYYRYLAEFKSDAEREEATSQSLKAYEAATVIAETDLPPTNPIRLGLALNFSVFYYEIIANTERACNMAKQAFEDAAAELDSLDKKSYQDSSLIMRLIGDNLTLWTPDPAEDE